ncbi:MAG: putative PEP-binding protein [Pseudomonadota bacterium]|nr:putative PEP-binding protein [Pseudomonadota bacterium]
MSLNGSTASAGLASGPVWCVREAEPVRVPMAVADEADALHVAFSDTAMNTATLLGALDGEAARIMDFQMSLLDSNVHLESALARIADGRNAALAWRDVLNLEIADYQCSEDPYFLDRIVDLADVRDRVCARLSGLEPVTIPAGVIVVADDIAPSVFLGHDWTDGGIALRAGESNRHVVSLAQQFGVPAIVGIGHSEIAEGLPGLLDADAGTLVVSPGKGDAESFRQAREVRDAGRQAKRAASAASGNGACASFKLVASIAAPAETSRLPSSGVDGIGLMFGAPATVQGFPGEKELLTSYRELLDRAHGQPVTICAREAGISAFPGHTPTGSSANEAQMRALLRAAACGDLRVALRSISRPEQLRRTFARFEAEADLLSDERIAHAMPALGVVVEAPAVAITPERFSPAAFFLIDLAALTRNTLGLRRETMARHHDAQAAEKAVLALVSNLVRHATGAGLDVGLCLEDHDDAEIIPALLETGLRSFAAPPRHLDSIRAALEHALDHAGPSHAGVAAIGPGQHRTAVN